MLETFLRDFGLYWHESITQLQQICRLHIHDANLPFHHIPKTVEAIWEKWTHCHVQETSLRLFELCDMVHYPAGSTSEDGYTVVIKGWTWSATIFRLAVAFKRCTIGTKCAKKISPTPLHHHQPEPLRQGRMDPCFHVLYAKLSPYHLNHQTRQCFSNLLLSNFGDPVWIVSSVSCSYLTGAAPGVVFCCWSTSASGFDVLCVQRWYSAYLGCNEWLFELNTRTFDINKAFSSTQLPLTGYFLFFGPFSVNPRDGCVWKSQ